MNPNYVSGMDLLGFAVFTPTYRADADGPLVPTGFFELASHDFSKV